ncbi:hypothetical protein HDU92_001503 [Lobulomyces angularis]|nr:hypothetical protein HDU92_001503 [Lobulomyces angularis]
MSKTKVLRLIALIVSTSSVFTHTITLPHYSPTETTKNIEDDVYSTAEFVLHKRNDIPVSFLEPNEYILQNRALTQSYEIYDTSATLEHKSDSSINFGPVTATITQNVATTLIWFDESTSLDESAEYVYTSIDAESENTSAKSETTMIWIPIDEKATTVYIENSLSEYTIETQTIEPSTTQRDRDFIISSEIPVATSITWIDDMPSSTRPIIAGSETSVYYESTKTTEVFESTVQYTAKATSYHNFFTELDSSTNAQTSTSVPISTTTYPVPVSTTAVPDCTFSEKDCNGNCPGTAKFLGINGGGRDACGVCGGNGTVGCLQFYGIEPKVVPHKTGQNVTIIGGGFLPVGNTSIAVTLDGNLIDQSQLFVLNDNILIYQVGAEKFSSTDLLSFNLQISKQYQISVSKNIFMYDPEISTLNEKPYFNIESLLTDKENVKFLINANNLLKLTSSQVAFFNPTCVFKLNDLSWQSSAVYVTGEGKFNSSYSCGDLPTFEVGGLLHVNLLYSKPAFATPFHPDVNNFTRPELYAWSSSRYTTVYTPPPNILDTGNSTENGNTTIPTNTTNTANTTISTQYNGNGVYFSNTGASIKVMFDSTIKLINSTIFTESNGLTLVPLAEPILCSQVFDTSYPNNAGYLQSSNSLDNRDCIVTLLPTSITLTFSGSFTSKNLSAIKPGDYLKLLSNTVTRSLEPYSLPYTSRWIQVNYPIIIPLPEVIINSPHVIGGCVDYSLDFSSVSGASGRPWKLVSINFEIITGNVTLEQKAQIQSDLDAGASSVTFGSTQISIPKEVLPEGAYSFSATFENFLSGKNTETVSVTKFDAKEVPFVIITSDNGYGALPVSSSNYLRASATTISACNISDTVEFNWISADEKLNLSNPSRATQVFAPYSFEAETTYEFNLQAKYSQFNKWYNYTISLTTVKSLLTVSAGPSRSVGTSSELILSAMIIDSSKKDTDYSNLACTWKCTDTNFGLPCVNQNQEVITFDDSCKGVNKTGEFPEGNYQIDVSVVKGDDSTPTNGSPSFLTILAGKPPLINIFASELNPSSFSPSFNLRANVDYSTISSSTNLVYTWTSESSCNSEAYSSVPLENGVTTATDPGNPALIFIPGKLKSGTEYCFKVQVHDTLSKSSGSSSIIITTKEAPSGGICKINSQAPTLEYSDKVKIQCAGWTTDAKSNPIGYLFYIKNKDVPNSDWSVIRGYSPSSFFSNVYPAGNFQIKVKIIDSAFSETYSEIMEFEVIKPSIEKRSLQKRASAYQNSLNFIEDAAKDFGSTKNAADAVIALNTVKSSLPGDIASDAEAVELQLSILEFMATVVTSEEWFLDATNESPTAADILLSAVGTNWKFKETSCLKLFGLTEKTVNLINKNVADSCYDSSTATKFAKVLDAVISSLNANSVFSSTIANKFLLVVSVINKCQFNVQKCGKSDFKYSGTSVNYSLGNSNPTSPAVYGNIQVASLSATQCYQYTYSEVTSKGLLTSEATSNLVATDKNILSFSLFDETTGEKILSPNMTGTILVAKDFEERYLNKPKYAAAVATIEFLSTDSVIATNGTTVLAANSGVVKFSSLKAGSFLAVVKEVPVTETATPSATPTVTTTATATPTLIPGDSTSAAAIGGGVGGGIVGLGLIACIALIVKRKKSKKNAINGATGNDAAIAASFGAAGANVAGKDNDAAIIASYGGQTKEPQVVIDINDPPAPVPDSQQDFDALKQVPEPNNTDAIVNASQVMLPNDQSSDYIAPVAPQNYERVASYAEATQRSDNQNHPDNLHDASM